MAMSPSPATTHEASFARKEEKFWRCAVLMCTQSRTQNPMTSEAKKFLCVSHVVVGLEDTFEVGPLKELNDSKDQRVMFSTVVRSMSTCKVVYIPDIVHIGGNFMASCPRQINLRREVVCHGKNGMICGMGVLILLVICPVAVREHLLELLYSKRIRWPCSIEHG